MVNGKHLKTGILLALTSAFCGSGCCKMKCDHDKQESQIMEQVKTAMLCKQKHSWEFGVAMQALIAVSYTHLRAHETNNSIAYAVFCL